MSDYRARRQECRTRKGEKLSSNQAEPGQAIKGNQIGCCLVSLHFLSNILSTANISISGVESSLTSLYHPRAVLFENETYRQTFELLCIYAGRFSGLIPISFLTGFYVTQVVTRWWSEFLTLPWPDKIAFRLVSYIPGKVLSSS